MVGVWLGHRQRCGRRVAGTTRRLIPQVALNTLGRLVMARPKLDTEARPAIRGVGIWLLLAGVVLTIATGACAMLANTAQVGPPEQFTYEIVNEYPHDPNAFTQGLLIDDGHFLESTGKYGQSSLRRVDIKTGRIVKIQRLPDDVFAEGITVWDDKIFMLTWRNRQILVFDRESFRLTNRYRFQGEGWGLTHNDNHLIVSNGTDTLRFLNPNNLAEARRIRVTDSGRPVQHLNELEYIDGSIYANIWYVDRIARIDPQSGRVTGWIDLSTLWPARQRPTREHVLNGIAWDAEDERLFVTGKNWPKMYEIRVVPVEP